MAPKKQSNIVEIVLRIKDNASKQMAASARASKALKSSFKSLAKAGLALGAIGLGIGLATKKILDLAAAGEDLRTAELFMNSLAKQAGATGAAIRESMADASEGLVSTADLVIATNKVLGAQATATQEDLNLIAEAGTKLGIAMGVGAARGVDTFATAIATGRTQSLAYLGIAIDSAEETKKFAASLGISASALTAAQKGQALYNATLREAAIRLEALSEFAVGFGGNIDRAKTSIVNFRNDLEKFTSAFADALMPALTEATGLTDDFGRSLRFSNEDALAFAKEGLGAIVDGLAFTAEFANASMRAIDLLGLAYGRVKILGEFFMTDTSGVIGAIKNIREDAKKVVDDMIALDTAFGKNAKKNSDFFDDLNERLAKFRAGISTISLGNFEGAMDNVAKKSREIADSTKETVANVAKIATEAGTNLVDSFLSAQKAFADISKDPILIEFQFEPEQLLADVQETISKAPPIQITTDIAGNEMLKTATNIGESITQGVESALQAVGDAVGGIVKVVITIILIIVAIIRNKKEIVQAAIGFFELILNNINIAGIFLEIILEIVIGFIKSNVFDDIAFRIIEGLIGNLPALIIELLAAIPLLIVKLVIGLLRIFTPGFWVQIFSNSKQAILESWREGAVAWTDEVGPAMDNLTKSFQDVFDTFGQSFPELWGKAWDGFVAAWDTGIRAFEESWFEFIEKLKGFFGGGKEGGIAKAVDLAKGGKTPEAIALAVAAVLATGGLALGAAFLQAGTDFVPRDGPAFLHRGERVVPARQNLAGAGGGGIMININNPSFRNENDMDILAAKLVNIISNNRRGAATSLRTVLNG